MTFAVGSLVQARGREWVVQPESEADLLILRPLGGTDDEVTGVYLPFEGDGVRPAHLGLPSPEDLGDHRSCRLLRGAMRLGFRAIAGPFRSFARIACEPRPPLTARALRRPGAWVASAGGAKAAGGRDGCIRLYAGVDFTSDSQEDPGMLKNVKIIVEKHPDGYVAYPVGLKGVVVAQGDTYEEALADARSAIEFHIETFGDEVLEDEDVATEVFIAEAAVAV